MCKYVDLQNWQAIKYIYLSKLSTLKLNNKRCILTFYSRYANLFKE